jgi:sugar/nucleoside kinase (ribokinase family)
MSNQYVIAVGTACVDEYYEADRWPGLGDKGLVRPTGEVVGGMIANAACVLAGYGVDTRMFDSMNRRQAGFILKDLAGYGLDVSRVWLDDSLPDAKCIIVRSGEDRTILVVDNARPEIALSEEEMAFFEGAAFVYTTPIELKRFRDAARWMDRLRGRGVRFVLVIESSTYEAEDAPLIERASILFFNEFGFTRCCGGESPENFRRRLFDAGVELITVTLGAEGSETFSPVDSDRTPGCKVPVVDPTGAGDTFNSSFLYCILNGHDIHAAARFANAAASDSVTRMGPKSGVGDAGRVWALVKARYGG